eukprot:3364665-Pyramimonas_sp.AAC.1
MGYYSYGGPSASPRPRRLLTLVSERCPGCIGQNVAAESGVGGGSCSKARSSEAGRATSQQVFVKCHEISPREKRAYVANNLMSVEHQYGPNCRLSCQSCL